MELGLRPCLKNGLVKLFNTAIGFRMVPHAPSFLSGINRLTAALRHVGGFSVSVFTAIPGSSGSSDYYGSCVTMPV